MHRAHYSAVLACMALLWFNLCSHAADHPTSRAQPEVTATRVIVYQPQPPPGIAHKGMCFTRSLALSRPDVYRCSTEQNVESAGGANLFDPCFALPNEPGRLACAPDPAKGAPGILLELTEPLPSEPFETPGVESAWIVELEDGVVCEINTGATFLVNGERASYGCTDGSWLFGDLHADTIWTALRGTTKGNPPHVQFAMHSTVKIRTVWH